MSVDQIVHLGVQIGSGFLGALVAFYLSNFLRHLIHGPEWLDQVCGLPCYWAAVYLAFRATWITLLLMYGALWLLTSLSSCVSDGFRFIPSRWIVALLYRLFDDVSIIRWDGDLIWYYFGHGGPSPTQPIHGPRNVRTGKERSVPISTEGDVLQRIIRMLSDRDTAAY